jgi:hypothetical protein
MEEEGDTAEVVLEDGGRGWSCAERPECGGEGEGEARSERCSDLGSSFLTAHRNERTSKLALLLSVGVEGDVAYRTAVHRRL